MKRYRHKRHDYIVEAEERSYDSGPGKFYRIEGYRPQLLANPLAVPGPIKTYYTILGMDDFNELFEPVSEYCCNWFTKCVRRRIIRKSTIEVKSGQQEWVWDALDEWFTECPFCKTKL